MVNEMYRRISRDSPEVIYSGFCTTCGRFLDLPRKTGLMAMINRMRKEKPDIVKHCG